MTTRQHTEAQAAATPIAADAVIEPIAYRYDRPVAFYSLAGLVTWLCWVAAGWLSHRTGQGDAVRWATVVLGLAGLAAPVGVAAWLMRGRPQLWADVRSRLLWRRGTSARHLALSVLLLPASLMAAQAISLPFGGSADQFQLRDHWSFSSGLLPVWVILGLAPVIEELAWHSYGTDTLITRMRLLTASLVFTVFWTVWHVPLALVKGYYQAQLVEQGWLDALNFPLSMIAFVLLMNWLYYRTGRCIMVAILFHLSANYVNEIFRTEPDTKVIQTALLLVVAAVVVYRERGLFFARPRRTAEPPVAA